MTRSPLIGPSSPPEPDAEPPSAVVPQPVSTRPAATKPTVSFRTEAVRICSSLCPADDRRLTEKVASRVVRVTLACAVRFVVVVSTDGGVAGLWCTAAASGPREGGPVSRRLSLAGQLLALQVVIICVVLVGVAAVTVAQSTERAQEVEGRRALAVAETVANTRAVRDAVQRGGITYVRVAAESSRSVSGSASVAVVDVAGNVLASADPEELGRRFPLGNSPVLQGRSWVGDGT